MSSYKTGTHATRFTALKLRNETKCPFHFDEDFLETETHLCCVSDGPLPSSTQGPLSLRMSLAKVYTFMSRIGIRIVGNEKLSRTKIVTFLLHLILPMKINMF